MRAQGSAKPTCPALAPRDTLHPRRRVVLSHVRYARVSMGTGLKQRADSLSLDRESLPTCLTMESRPPPDDSAAWSAGLLHDEPLVVPRGHSCGGSMGDEG